ncbi:GGDEF domain-containing protein [Vibrio sp. MA40-2]|uniref:GGDEF domain-containing protein n=1 Tax=Vibrio sp. MA40-2 TaxID=3391828 RepID=UPI0039A5A13F
MKQSSTLKSKLHKTGWLWLSLFCFGMLFVIAILELSFLYPQVQRYFDSTGSLTAQPLAARSRQYMIDSLEIATKTQSVKVNNKDIVHKLNLAYGLLNIELYKRRYSCTSSALTQIDQLVTQLESQQTFNLTHFNSELLPALKCTETIQTGQEHHRSEVANNLLNNIDFYHNTLFWGSFLMITAAIGFGVLHVNQTRQMSNNRKETAQWRRHAMRDELTGIWNRRALNTDLDKLIQNHATSNPPFSLLMCDIDYFKQYNDTYGHIEGDTALKSIANVIESALRETDNLYRYGGEEMVIILNETDNQSAKVIARRLLSLVENLNLPHPTSSHGRLTISIGSATTNNDGSDDVDSILQTADKRLYLAKKNGRHCLVAEDGLDCG